MNANTARAWFTIAASTVVACGTPHPTLAAPVDEFAKTPTLKATSLDDVRSQALAWLDAQAVGDDVKAQAEAIWQSDSALTQDVLDRLAATFALADERAAKLVELCAQPRSPGLVPPQEWLTDEKLSALERNNLRLYFGRWLSLERLYDESLAQLAGLEPPDVIDPAALLFFTAVGHHRLLHKDDGLKSIDRLLAEVVEPPQRYVAVAGLMREDLKGLKDDSLDHIARRMDDVRRRLDLGRAGDKTRKVEDGVVKSLDKLIEELEKQQQQQQQQSAAGGGQQSSKPMQDSRLARQNAAGDVQRKNIGNSAGWGDLPAKDREAALQQIGKDFPSHYREVIEQYFRKLATEESGDE